MTPHDTTPLAGKGEGRSLAHQAEQVTQQLQAGEDVPDAGDLGTEARPAVLLRKLLPTLRDLTELGHRLARDRRSATSAFRADGPSRPSDPEETSR